MAFEVVKYNRAYKRDTFSCGKPSLDNYLVRNATKDVRAGACTCFVVLDNHNQVIAYYTLAADSVQADGAPEEIKKHIRYDAIPVILLGRLAVHENVHGKGYGALLLADALKRSLKVAEEQIGSVAVVVDPIDDEAEQFYSKFGFAKLPDSGRMFMTIRKIKEAVEKSNKK